MLSRAGAVSQLTRGHVRKDCVQQPPIQYPSTRGSHSAIPGNTTTIARATNIAMIIQNTQGIVDSMDVLAILQDTIKLTASGGVNWPIATFIVRMTPNQTRSHP